MNQWKCLRGAAVAVLSEVENSMIYQDAAGRDGRARQSVVAPRRDNEIVGAEERVG